MIRRFRIKWLAGVILLLAIPLIDSSSQVKTPRTYTIAISPWIADAPASVAEAKGFWKQEGVSVKVINFADDEEFAKQFNNKKVDFSLDMIGTMASDHINREPVTILAELDWSYGGDKIIVKKGFNFKDSKNKVLGIYEDTPAVSYVVYLYLTSLGLKMSDFKVEFLENSELADQFIAGKIPLIICYDPDAIRAVKEGNGLVAATTATFKGSMPEGIYGFQSILKNIPRSDLEKILKGWVRAVNWINQPVNWKEFQGILNKYTFPEDGPYSEQELKEMLGSVKIHNAQALREANQPGGSLESYLASLKKYLKENNLLTKDFTYQTITDTSVLMKVLNEMK